MSEKPEDQLREERFCVLDRTWGDKAEELVPRAVAAVRREKAARRKENRRTTEQPQ